MDEKAIKEAPRKGERVTLECKRARFGRPIRFSQIDKEGIVF